MWGTDVDRLLQVNISSVAKGRWSFTARAIDERTNGQKLLGLLEFLDLLQPPYAVALAPPAQPARYLTKLERPAVSGIIPSLFREVVEAHAHVELALGVGIPVPDAYSGPQISRLLETATLLRGERVMNAWTSFRWTVTAAEARTLMDGVFREDGLALIELEQEWTLQFGNNSVDVGVVLATYEQARLVPLDLRRYGDGDQVELTVRAGISDAVTYRLIEVHGRPSKEPDQRWFWEDDWQRREREVDELVTAGEVRVHDGVDAFLDHLDNVAPE